MVTTAPSIPQKNLNWRVIASSSSRREQSQRDSPAKVTDSTTKIGENAFSPRFPFFSLLVPQLGGLARSDALKKGRHR
jgi:hypothetical protein